MTLFSLNKATGIKDWVDDTWVERDAEQVLQGVTDEYWRMYPDVDVLSFITIEATDKIPLVWIDGQVYYYSQAMKILKAHTKAQSKKTPTETPQEEELLAMTA